MPKKLTPKGHAAPPVEPNIGPSIPRKPASKPAAPAPVAGSDLKYVRNLHNIKARVTLTTRREIQLEPRGQREDLDVVTAEDREDPRFLANLGLIFEVIEPDEAKSIIAKQRTNSKFAANPIWEQLRNEQGKPYEQRAVQIEEAFERQGEVVGRIEETGGGRFSDKNVEIRRSGPSISQVPGSPGHPATDAMLQGVPNDVTPEEYHEFLLWKKFKEMKTS